MNIHEYVAYRENLYETETVKISGVEYNQKKRIDAIELASLACYAEGDEDSILGRLQYDDIITDKVEKEAQILDFDTKHMDIAPDDPTDEARWSSAVATSGARDEMEEQRYGSFFNKFVRTYSKYGGVLTKDTEDGPKVISWHNVVTDQTDILSGVIIERHYMTPAELKKMEGKWQNVDIALTMATEEKESEPDREGEASETQGHYIEIHEVRGEIPMNVLEVDGDPKEFKRVFMILAGVHQAPDGEKSEDKGVILFESEETKNPYKYLARNPIDGIALGRGLVEELLPQQVMHNFLLNEEMRMVAIAGKIFGKTNKKEIPNSVAQIDHLTTFKLNDDEYFELTSALPSGLPGFRDLRDHIQSNVRNISGMHEAISGEEGRANKTLGLHRIQNIETHSRFRPTRQDIGFHLEEIIKEWVLPKAIRKMRNADNIYSVFTDAQILEIDRVIRNKMLSKKLTELTLEGTVITPEVFASMEQEVQRELGKHGKKRAVEGIKQWLKTIGDNVRITFTDESFSKEDFFDNHVSLIQLMGPEHPWSRALIRRAMDESGITPEVLAIEEERASQLSPGQGSISGVELAGNEQQAPAQQV